MRRGKTQKMVLFDKLEVVEWATREFGSLITNRQFPRRDMLRLVKAGYCKSCGLVPMCDDDCCIMVPERYRGGFKLTSDGRKKLREIRNVIEGEGE